MRWLLFASMLLLGCQGPLTIPAGRLPAYAANEPVLTEEGFTVSLADGGDLELVALRGKCLEEVETLAGEDGGRITRLESRDRVRRCQRHTVDVVRNVAAGPTIEIAAPERTVAVRADAMAGVRLHGARMSSASYAPETGLQSGGALGAGIALLAAGTIGGLGLLAAGLTYESSGFIDLTGVFMIIGAPLVFGVGAGAGIPLIVIGSEQVRLPAAEQPRFRARASGFALEW